MKHRIKDTIPGVHIIDRNIYDSVDDWWIGNQLFYLVEKNGKWGCLNEKMEIVLPCVYSQFETSGILESTDEITIHKYRRYKVRKNRLYGYVDENWEEIIPCCYTSVSYVCNGLILAKYDKKYGYLDINGKVVIPFQYNKATIFSEGKAWVKKRGFNGFINTKGEIIKENCKYTKATPFDNGCCIITERGGMMSLINDSFNTIIPPTKNHLCFSYNHIEALDDSGNVSAIFTYDGKEINDGEIIDTIHSDIDYYIVRNKDLYGIIDENKTVVVPFKYSQYHLLQDVEPTTIILGTPFYYKILCYINKTVSISRTFEDIKFIQDHYFKTEKNGKYGVIDLNGNEILPCEFDYIQGNGTGPMNNKEDYIPDSYYFASKNKKSCLFDSHWKIELECTFDKIVSAKRATPRFVVNKDSKEYIYNAQTKIWSKIGFDHIQYYGDDDYAKATLSGKPCIINLDGELVINNNYDLVERFSEGLAKVKKDGKYGFINNKEEVVVPFKYTGSKSFSEGLAAVRTDGLYGFINLQGQFVIQPIFHDAMSFQNGIAKIRINNKNLWGAINKNGTIIVDCIYQSVEMQRSTNIIVVFNGKKYGCFKTDGTIVLPCEFDSVITDYDCIYATIKSITIIVDFNGKQIKPSSNSCVKSTIHSL